MAQAICASCSRPFSIRPQTPTQTFCSEAECQRRRRQAWNKHKLANDADYRANQLAAERAWHARNPDYWPAYRLKRKQQDAASPTGATRATSDASFCGAGASAELCWIEIQAPGPNGQAQTWRVELTLKPPPTRATSDACK
jgi:hypothetical protein